MKEGNNLTEVTRIVTGAIQENCYLVSSQHNTLIIDPGADAWRIIQTIDDKKLKPRAILLTHAHCDHIGAVTELRQHYHIPVYMNEKEREWLSNPELNLSLALYGEPIICEEAEFNLDIQHCERCLGDIHFKMIPTPGHTEGGVSLLFDDFIMTGDTLFYHSIGRTDFPTGNKEQLLDSIHQQLLTLYDDLIVYPGHGKETTIGEERAHNPFL